VQKMSAGTIRKITENLSLDREKLFECELFLSMNISAIINNSRNKKITNLHCCFSF
jgi:hypothetical protein